MKTISNFLGILFLLTVSIYSQVKTNAGIPDASRVLVVYNQNLSVSESVKNYYRDARGIPTENIVQLTLPTEPVTIDNETHLVGLDQETDIIRDFYQHHLGTSTATKHAFKYYLDKVATPIRNWLTSHNLTSTIRYIVLCKGVPFKIQSAGDLSGVPPPYMNGNLTVDGLLCMLNTPGYDNFILNQVFYYTGGCSNPYYNTDPNLSMDFRFLPDHFVSNEGQHLSYLVSHLDGISFEIVKNIIDKSIYPDMSGTAAWILDHDPTKGGGSQYFTLARDKLIELGFNVLYDETDSWITSYQGSVMGYSSWGTHAEDYNCDFNDSAWVKDSLHFNLANGSVFNTYESFNGNSLTTLNWRFVAVDDTCSGHTQGLATQFTEIGGTATMGHAWEPFLDGPIVNSIFFPAYQMGYNVVDAYYQGLLKLAWQNVLVADPLVRIFNSENTVITSDTTISSGDYQGNIVVPANVRLIIDDGETVNFKRNAKLEVYGTLEILQGAVLNFNAYSMLIQGTGSRTIISPDAVLNFKDHSTLNQGNGSGLIVSENIAVNFTDYSTFEINDYFIFEDNSPFYFESCNFIINGTAEISTSSPFILANGKSCIVKGSLRLNEGTMLNIQDNSTFSSNGILNFLNSCTLTMNNISRFLSTGEIVFNEAVTINLQIAYPGEFSLGGIIKSLGSINNCVTVNCYGNEYKCSNVDTLILQHTRINSGYIGLKISDKILKPRLLSINNCIITSNLNNYFSVDETDGVDITLADNYFTTSGDHLNGLFVFGFNRAILLRNIVENLSNNSFAGINITKNKTVDITDCIINNYMYGILRGSPISETNSGPPLLEDIKIYNNIIEGGQLDTEAGICINADQRSEVSGVRIDLNNISNYQTGIFVNNSSNFLIHIKNNTILNYKSTGISLNNGHEGVIKENIITAIPNANNLFAGISVDLVRNPSIIGNIVTSPEVQTHGSGIVSVSCNGEIRQNTIQNYQNGIELGSSSPKIGANTITDNIHYGILINDNSFPDLSEAFTGGEEYPLSGYNTIRENGDPDLGGFSELYLENSSVNMEKGCNTIADDREGDCNLLLIDGLGVPDIKANRNYWGRHPYYGNDPSRRFGEEIIIDYSDYLLEPCTYSPGSSELILADSYEEVYDTLYSTGEVPPLDLPEIETRYASANNYYYHNQYSQAKEDYDWIIQNYGSSRASLQAYTRLFTLANLMDNPVASFYQLKEFYLDKAENQTDSLMMGTLTHLSNLCLVSAEDYLTAINNFDLIAQQNPNTDIAFYRQVDALTTALLLPDDSTMNKGISGKYIVNGFSDYTKKISELIKNRGTSATESGKDVVPTSYALYQNYPNPFNPVTTIKYDLPVAGNIALTIYDILGRKVRELVNSKQQAGKYEVNFDASDLASGVYVYQLKAETFMNSKKMMVLK